jgi:hypothetical protein
MATLDLPLPASSTVQIQIEGKNTVARLSGKRQRVDPLLASTRKSGGLFGSVVKILGWHREVGGQQTKEQVSCLRLCSF